MPINDFKPFATGPGANVTPKEDWENLPALLSGFVSGKASSAQMNKAFRQASFIAAALAQFVSEKTDQDVLDDGDLPGFVEKLTAGFAAQYLSRSNPFGDIASDGPEAIATALANLGLGTAATKDVGAGDDELPTTSQVKFKSWVSAGRTLVDNTPLIINHGLTIDPDLCILNIRLRCVIANNGYAVGDYAVGLAPRFLVGNTSAMTGNVGALLTATQVQFNCGQSGVTVMSKSSGTPFGVSGSEHSNWAFEFHIIYQ